MIAVFSGFDFELWLFHVKMKKTIVFNLGRSKIVPLSKLNRLYFSSDFSDGI